MERAEAAETLAASLAALEGWAAASRARWWTAGPSTASWPRSRSSAPAQAVVITRPHAVADTFHTDWANKAQDQLGLPVLHLYAGSGFIGDS